MSRYADIAIAAANAQAESTRRGGQIWSSAFSDIGRDIAAIPGQMQQQKRQDALMLLEQAKEARARGEEERANALLAESQAVHVATQRIVGKAIKPDGTWDPAASVAEGQAAGRPDVAVMLNEKYQPKLTEHDPTKALRDPAGNIVVPAEPKPVTYGAPQPMMIGGKRALVRTGSDDKLYDMQGKPVAGVDIQPDQPPMTPYQGAELGMQGATRAETARHNRAMEAAAPKPDDAESIADAIISGDQPPVTTGLYRLAGPVRASLAKKGYDLTTANLDFQATQKHIATLNGAQQTRLRQAVATASDSLGVIEDLAKQWDAGKFPILNRGQLLLAKNGALGPKAQQIATNLEAQITDVTSELGNVYMGGNSPTDHALQLAGKNLSADWNKDQLLSAIQLARKNLQIRSNSMTSVGAAGLSTPPAQTPTAPPEGTLGTVNGVPAVWKTVNGKSGWYAR